MAEPSTTRNPGTALRLALAEARGARDQSAALVSGLDRAIAALEQAVEGSVQQAVQALPEPTAPPCPHRAAHRPGKPRRIDNDPELRAFISARIDRLTFHQLEAEIAATFPRERHVGKSAIHAWWQRQKPGKK
jgi:hypothetical protein